jgi:hypothetical protein
VLSDNGFDGWPQHLDRVKFLEIEDLLDSNGGLAPYSVAAERSLLYLRALQSSTSKSDEWKRDLCDGLSLIEGIHFYSARLLVQRFSNCSNVKSHGRKTRQSQYHIPPGDLAHIRLQGAQTHQVREHVAGFHIQPCVTQATARHKIARLIATELFGTRVSIPTWRRSSRMWPRDDGGGAGECNRAQVGSENQRYHWRLLTFSKLE